MENATAFDSVVLTLDFFVCVEMPILQFSSILLSYSTHLALLQPVKSVSQINGFQMNPLMNVGLG